VKPANAALASLVLGATLAPVGIVTDARAQGAGSATLRGSVLDPSGGAVPGAVVTVTSARTSATREAVTNASGAYVFPALTSGPYRLEVHLDGFAPWPGSEVHLSPGDSLNVNATLALAGQTEQVTIHAERQMVRQDHGAREGLITSDQIKDLSIVSRSALELVRILPGTVSPDLSLMETVSFNLGGANQLSDYSVNGTRGTTINPVIDGAKVVDFGCNCGTMLNMNADMVDEVKIQAGNYAAEYGGASVQVTAVTKSGSADFHGSVYDYWRNWRFAANDRSNNYAGVPRPESDYHYPGFNLSGPVLVPGTDFNKDRDKLFFFVGFELQRQTVDRGTTLAVVPTLSQRQGDFSEFLSGEGQNLGQPRTVTIPLGFPGAGQIAPNGDLTPYVDPLGQAFLNMYPLPNHQDPDNRYNYAFNPPIPVNRWQLTSRLDWNVSASTRAYVRLALEQEVVEDHQLWNCCSWMELPSPIAGDDKAWSVSLNVASVLNPTLTNEIVVSASRLELDNDWKDPAKVSLRALGLDGFQGVFPSESQEAPIGLASWGQGLGDLNAVGGMPLFAYNDSVSVADTLTKVMDTHTLKLGAFVERGRKHQNGDTNYGTIVLGSPWTPGGTGSDYGDLLVGRVAEFDQGTRAPRGEFRFWNFEGFVQDSWRIRRNLTFEAGLRVAYMPNNEEVNGLATRFEPSAYDRSQGPFIDGDPQRPNGVLLASRGEIPDGITRSPGVKLMPRFNFAWDVWGDGDVVLRGGTGLFYDRPEGNFQYYVTGQAPNVFNTSVTTFDVPGGLTLSSLPTIDPWSRLAASTVFSLDPESIHVPRTWNWSLALAKRLPWGQTLEVAYVGNRADHLPNRTRADYIEPGSLTGTLGNANLDNPLHRAALANEVAATLRDFPAYSDVWWYQYETWSTYHALQATLSRAAGRRFQYFVNYTFSKSRGAGVDDFATLDPIDPDERSVGILYSDRTHIFNASWNLLLPDPVGPDGNALLRQLLNGWQLSGITTYRSGLPYRIILRGELDQVQMQRAWWGTDAHLSAGANNTGAITPIFSGDPRTGSTGVGERFLDIDQIGIPVFGESGPFQQPFDFRVPTRWNWDLTVFKNFPLGGSKKIQLRVGFFNLLNQAAPDIRRGDLDFNLQTDCNVRVDGVPNGAGGLAYGVCDPSQGFHFTEQARQDFGRIITKRGHRVIELAVRFDF